MDAISLNSLFFLEDLEERGFALEAAASSDAGFVASTASLDVFFEGFFNNMCIF
jgi:hypothetical protein